MTSPTPGFSPLVLEVSVEQLHSKGVTTVRQALAELIRLVAWKLSLTQRDRRPIGGARVALRFRLKDSQGNVQAEFVPCHIYGKLTGGKTLCHRTDLQEIER